MATLARHPKSCDHHSVEERHGWRVPGEVMGGHSTWKTQYAARVSRQTITPASDAACAVL